MRNSTLVALALLGPVALVLTPLSNAHAARHWQIDQGTASLAFDESHLSDLGLRVVGERPTAAASGEVAEILSGTIRSFAVEPAGLATFTSEKGLMKGFTGTSLVRIPVRGGLALAGRNGATPVFLYDFQLDLNFAADKTDAVVLRTADPALPHPIDVANAGFLFRENLGEFAVCFADLQISPAWARALGSPELAGQYLGTLDLRLHATSNDAVERREAVLPEKGPAAPQLDVSLGQLYGLSSQGRVGVYPNGRNGLSAATTSCNVGGVNVPWNGPMAETHPFIGLAMFRKNSSGVLEEIGMNWMKHGFFALSNDDCHWGCPQGSDGSYLALGCSDTYSVSNNASQYYLGPRHEVNPFIAVWEACGSFFDEPTGVPDPGCNRSYNGNEPNGVNHRLEVWDEDLGNPGATYYYEGIYYVADDVNADNSVGWRGCTTSWNGSTWVISTTGGGLVPTMGPLVETWGDESHRKDVSTDDGPVILAVDVTDLGGGEFHYEYALYNWRSDRGVYSFSVPVGGAVVSNVGFHDIDKDAVNDWTANVAGGFVTWSTEDWATNPDANSLSGEEMFNFRFDANAAPVPAQAQGGIFKPGVGTTFFVDTQAPDGGGPVAATELRGANGLALSSIEPNPFGRSTRIAFSLPRREQARLTVFDVTGRTVRVLLNDVAPAGTRDVQWDGRDASGRNVASGVYLVRLETADGVRTSKVARLR